MILFKKTLFCGAGEHSKQQTDLLHRRLEEGIVILSGLQQPSHPENEQQELEDAAETTKALQELKDIVHDIGTAFGYLDILKRLNQKTQNNTTLDTLYKAIEKSCGMSIKDLQNKTLEEIRDIAEQRAGQLTKYIE